MELRRRETGECFALRDGLLFGRLGSCDVQIQDTSVSRQHARIALEEGNFVLVDLNSSNGCFQNGTRHQQILLRAGDLITLGVVAFDVVADEAAKPTAEVSPATTASPGQIEETARRRAQVRRQITGDGRSRGLGDLGQQPLSIRLLAAMFGLLVLYAVMMGVRWLAAML